MSSLRTIFRFDLFHAIQDSPASQAAKKRAITAIESTSSESFNMSPISKRWILELYARRFARARPVRVEGEETFLADIETISSDLVYVVSIVQGELYTSIWLDAQSLTVVSTLAGISHEGWRADQTGADSSSQRSIARPNEVIRLFGPTDKTLPGERGQLGVEWAGDSDIPRHTAY